MFPTKTSINKSAPADHHRPSTLRAAIDHLAQGMRELEEQLPLPKDRRVRSTTSAQRKLAALRLDIEEFNLRLMQMSQQIKAMGRSKE